MYAVAQGQVTLVYHGSYPPKVLRRFFCVYGGFSYSCEIFGQGDPSLEFTMMAASVGRGGRILPPAATSDELPGTTYSLLEGKTQVCGELVDTCAYSLHTGLGPNPHRPVATEFKLSHLAI